ncbi:hypothetical protein E3N88_13001 [Mikania micrantha]|uniref:Uncharacterized protein n=1 Tax=Mikania micrantha TaxID=192012 RepID=A0A5N6P8Y0_9ASTR|nr:hypothetical protein E3N88_13001 [Mikania micrantha]
MELEGRFITSKDDRLPIESGIGPEIELDPSSRVCKDDNFPKKRDVVGEERSSSSSSSEVVGEERRSGSSLGLERNEIEWLHGKCLTQKILKKKPKKGTNKECQTHNQNWKIDIREEISNGKQE